MGRGIQYGCNIPYSYELKGSDRIGVDTFLIEDVIDDMTWSFSRLNSFGTCKRGWYINYILGVHGENNFFGEFGTFVHKIMEKHDKGELELFELEDYYDEHYKDAVIHDAPYNRYVDLNERYYNQGKEFLHNFEGHNDKTLGVELEIHIDLDKSASKKKTLIGYIDRLSQDDKGIIITDYKSKSKFINDDEKEHYLLQLYLYSWGVFELYHEFPYKLQFHMFRDNIIVEEYFNMDKAHKALAWANDVITSIYKEQDFPLKCGIRQKDFFCLNLCGCKDKCFELERVTPEELESTD